MGTTANYGISYPELTTDPDIPRDIQAVADGADTAIKSVEDKADANTAAAIKVTTGTIGDRPTAGMKQGDIHCVTA